MTIGRSILPGGELSLALTRHQVISLGLESYDFSFGEESGVTTEKSTIIKFTNLCIDIVILRLS